MIMSSELISLGLSYSFFSELLNYWNVADVFLPEHLIIFASKINNQTQSQKITIFIMKKLDA